MRRLEEFPREILATIASYCTPADVVNLAAACPLVNDAVIPGLYRYIIIDPVPHALYDNRLGRYAYVSAAEGERMYVLATPVHTIAGIKQLLETLANNRELAQHVRSLVVKGNIAMSDIALIRRLRLALKNLVKLNEFEWTACPELPPSILEDLPRDEMLALAIDLATRPGDVEYPAVSFPHLRKLQIRPFLSADLLRWMKRAVSSAEHLEDVQLGRYLDTKSEIGSSFTFIGRSDIHGERESIPAIEIFFKNAARRSLRQLKLDQIDTSVEDCAVLAESVDLSGLKELQLIGSGREDESAHGLLEYVSKAAPQLVRAELSWEASLSRTVNFLESCCANVRSLKLHIKAQPKEILAVLSRVCKHLRYLDIQLDCEFGPLDLLELQGLTKLEVLRIPFNHIVHSWGITGSMSELKVLELRTQLANVPNSNRTSRQTSMGLLSGGIFEEYNNPFCLPVRYVNFMRAHHLNPSLEYLIVDGRVTQLRSNVLSREAYAW